MIPSSSDDNSRSLQGETSKPVALGFRSGQALAWIDGELVILFVREVWRTSSNKTEVDVVDVCDPEDAPVSFLRHESGTRLWSWLVRRSYMASDGHDDLACNP
jgi:hypothetical protein